jgi:hypothetical protein
MRANERFVSIATIMALVNCIAGCTSVSTSPRDRLTDIHAEQQPRVMEVKISYRKTLQFDRLGGRLNKKGRRVTGIGPKGNWIRAYYRDIMQLTLAVPHATGWREMRLGPDEFTTVKSGTSWSRIVGVSTCSGEQLKFDRRGGLFLLPDSALVGYQPTGALVSLAYDEIADVRMRHSDDTKTALLILGASAVAVALIIASIQLDSFGDSGCCF